MNSQDWKKIKTLSCSDVDGDYSIVQFSFCGTYLAASSIQGDFVIFEVSTEKVINKSKHPNGSTICGLMWNPTSNLLLSYFDVQLTNKNYRS